MKSSFIAYVDESGYEGFVFNADGSGSSRWFVLSAAVIRQTNNLQMVSCLKEVRAYLRLLLKQAEANPSQVQIDRTVIDPERISAVEHSKLAGLQVADAVASGFHFALKVNRYGETETGYLPHLKKTIYRHKAAALGYGLKLWPEDFATVKAKAPEALKIEGL